MVGTEGVMPKVADHDARRQQVAQAVWRVVREHGLEGTTMRRVAAEADMSIGLVQHYFSSKEQMERFAFDRVIAAAQERMAERVEAMGVPACVRTVIRMILAELTIPTDEQRLAEYQVVLSFSLRALQRPDLARELHTSHAALHHFIAAQLRQAQRQGEVPAELDPEVEATLLLCFADGCGQRILLGQLDSERGVEALDHMLARLFTARLQEMAVGITEPQLVGPQRP
jgi:TetR/AcrR family transcriptional regulator, transcriptional repressor of bet genes